MFSGAVAYCLDAIAAPAMVLLVFGVAVPPACRCVIAAENSLDPQRLFAAVRLWWALRRREIIYHYQPIVSLRTGRVLAAEALARWARPGKGLLAPGRWLAATEIPWLEWRFNAYTLRSVVTQVRDWRALGFDVVASVNVTPRCLNEKLPALLQQILEQAGVPATSIRIELTEAVLASAGMEIVARQLADLGVGLALDDFGIGHSAMERLVTLPVAALKVDRRFVGGRPNDRGTSVLRAAIGLCRDLGISCIAEGVEEAEVMCELRELGCDYAQGYFICRPLPPTDLIAWLGGEHQQAAAPEQRRVPCSASARPAGALGFSADAGARQTSWNPRRLAS